MKVTITTLIRMRAIESANIEFEYVGNRGLLRYYKLREKRDDQETTDLSRVRSLRAAARRHLRL